MIHVLPAKLEHIRLVARDMRPRDISELEQGFNQTPQQVMLDGVRWSTKARTMLYGTVPLCMYGVLPFGVLAGHHLLWIVATQEIDRHPLAFARASKRYLPELMRGVSTVTNLVAVADQAAVSWAHWLGCDLRPYDCNREFLQFFLQGDGVCHRARSLPAA